MSNINKDEYRPQDWALGDTNRCWFRVLSFDNYPLGSAAEERTDPSQYLLSYAIIMELPPKFAVVDFVEGFGKVK